MITIATPLSAVSTMQSLSFLSSLIAKFCALIRLGLGGWEALSTQFISVLSSSASCWLSLVQAASIAVIYSNLGGCLEVTAKLGPLASTDLCAGVKGLLDKLITHFGLGSSKGEEPCRVLCLLGKDLASWEALAWGDATWGTALSGWETTLSTLGVVPACLVELPAWGMCLAWEALSPCRVPDSLAKYSTLCLKSTVLWRLGAACLGNITLGKSAVFWGGLGTACLGELILCWWKSAIYWGGLGTACLGELTLCWWKSAIYWGSLGTACLGDITLGKSTVFQGGLGTACLGELTLCWWKSAIYWGSLGTACWEISLWGRVLSPGEEWELPAWEDWVLPAWESALSAGERVLSARRAWGLPAWERALRGRALSS